MSLETGRACRNNLPMNKKEIAESLRTEVGHLELEIKKLQARCERLKTFVLDLEDEIVGPVVEKTAPDSQFRKVIDTVFGEKSKQPKR
jgi:hypothetical protein